MNFNSENFKTPPKEFCPIYSWIWNSPITKDIIEKEIDEMYTQGIRGMYIIPEPPEFRPGRQETTMTPEYLSDEFFELVRYAVEYASGKGFVTWLYDEGGWPSGSACGRVTKENPGLCAKRLAKKTLTLKPGEKIPDTPDIISVFCNGERVTDFVAETDTEITVYCIEVAHRTIPHLQDKNAVDAFINSTYEKYKKHLGDLFGKKTFAMFTDEAVLFYPFCVDCIDEFEAEYGYDFAEMVPALFDEWQCDCGKQFKVDYIDFCCRKFADAYVGALHNWCRENNLKFTGHMDGDNKLATFDKQGGNALYQLRYMDIPGIDVICEHIYPGSEENNFFPRLASSAAHQNGSDFAVTESFAVYGSGLTYSTMRYVCGYQFVRGINIINLMSVTSGRDGFLSAQCRPHFIPEAPGGDTLKHFNSYLARMMYITSIGKIDTDVALYMPMRDVWAGDTNAEAMYDELGRALEEKQIYFDVVDDAYIEDSEITEDGLGKAGYKTIFVPPTKYMSQKCRKKLEEFKNCGGTVCDSAANACGAVFCDNPNIRAMKRKTETENIYVLFNESTTAQTFEVEISRQHKNLYRLSATDGEIYEFNSKITLESGEELVFIETDSNYDAKPYAEKAEKIDVAEITSLVREKRHIFQNGKWEIVSDTASMEQWDSDFSGTAVYTAEFDGADSDVIIRIDNVIDTCEAEINGNSAGIRIMPPYEFEVPKDRLKDKNTLKLRVSNTGANVLCSTDFSEYPKEIKGPYHDVTLGYEKRELKSGILSEVKIMRRK